MTARLETRACKIQERKKREQLQAELEQLFAADRVETAMESPRIVPCEACGTEGVIYHGAGFDPWDWTEPCRYCEGTGGEIIETQPIDLNDLEFIATGGLLL